MKRKFKSKVALLLTTSIAFNVLADTNALAAKASVENKTAVANVSVSSRAESAKKVYDELTAKNKQLFERIESFSFVEKLNLTVENYTTNDNQSEVTEVVERTIKRSKKRAAKYPIKTVKTTVKYVVSYDEELMSKGIVARIKPVEYKALTIANGKVVETVEGWDRQTKITTDIYNNGRIHRKMISEEKSGAPGVEINYYSHMNSADKGYGKFDGQLTNLPKDETGAQFSTLNFEGEYSAENGLDISSTSPLLSKKDGKLTTINGLTLKLKMVELAGLNQPIPTFSIIAKGIATEVEQGVTATMDKMSLEVDAKSGKSGGVDLSMETIIKPSGAWMKQLSQGKLNLSNLTTKISFDELPLMMVNQISDEVVSGINEAYDYNLNEVTATDKNGHLPLADTSDKRMNELFQKNGETWFAEMQKLGAGPAIEIEFDTDQGNGYLNIDTSLKNIGMTMAALQSSKPSPELFLSLMDVKGESGLPAELIEALGVQMYLALAYQKKGDTYMSTIKTADNRLLVNDVPFDLSMFFPSKKKAKK